MLSVDLLRKRLCRPKGFTSRNIPYLCRVSKAMINFRLLLWVYGILRLRFTSLRMTKNFYVLISSSNQILFYFFSFIIPFWYASKSLVRSFMFFIISIPVSVFITRSLSCEYWRATVEESISFSSFMAFSRLSKGSWLTRTRPWEL